MRPSFCFPFILMTCGPFWMSRFLILMLLAAVAGAAHASEYKICSTLRGCCSTTAGACATQDGSRFTVISEPVLCGPVSATAAPPLSITVSPKTGGSVSACLLARSGGDWAQYLVFSAAGGSLTQQLRVVPVGNEYALWGADGRTFCTTQGQTCSTADHSTKATILPLDPSCDSLWTSVTLTEIPSGASMTACLVGSSTELCQMLDARGAQGYDMLTVAPDAPSAAPRTPRQAEKETS